jgi:hypothetical protein
VGSAWWCASRPISERDPNATAGGGGGWWGMVRGSRLAMANGLLLLVLPGFGRGYA